MMEMPLSDLQAWNDGGVRRARAPMALRVDHSNAYYDLNSASYGSRTGVAGTPPLMTQFLDAMPAGGQVADLGCGAGRDLAALVSAGLRCIGYDLSPKLAELARIRSGAPVVVADIRTLEMEPSSLDGVVAIASLLHLEREEIPAVLRRVAGWLRPDGLFLATMKEGSAALQDAEGRRFTFVGKEEWRAMLADAGLAVVESAGSDADPDVSSSGHSWIATLARRA